MGVKKSARPLVKKCKIETLFLNFYQSRKWYLFSKFTFFRNRFFINYWCENDVQVLWSTNITFTTLVQHLFNNTTTFLQPKQNAFNIFMNLHIIRVCLIATRRLAHVLSGCYHRRFRHNNLSIFDSPIPLSDKNQTTVVTIPLIRMHLLASIFTHCVEKIELLKFKKCNNFEWIRNALKLEVVRYIYKTHNIRGKNPSVS